MTQNEKDLLIKDLCARLPYGVWIERKLKSCKFGAKCMLHTHDIDAIERGQYDFYKPYLFPLSSMTEEQHKEFYDKYCWNDGGDNFEMDSCSHYYALEKFDWLLKNNFDIRGLIPMGLAIDATGKNIY